MTKEVHLSDLEIECLTAWREGGVGCGLPFRVVPMKTSVKPAQVRRVVRALARKGMLEYARALWSEEGPCGAGYCLTQQGADRLAKIMELRGWSDGDVEPIRRKWEI